jgi:hypothetical protein
MESFQTKYLTLGKFWRVLQWKMLVYFSAIGSILLSFLLYYSASWYILLSFGIFFPRFGLFYQENLATLKYCWPLVNFFKSVTIACACSKSRLKVQLVKRSSFYCTEFV